MAQSTLAGIFTAFASVITAAGLLVTAVTVLIPILRNQRIQDKKLDTIHVLVNSTLTAAKDAQRAGAVRELVLLREMRDLHTQAGRPETEAERSSILAAEQRVADLDAELRDRADQTEEANRVMQRDEN